MGVGLNGGSVQHLFKMRTKEEEEEALALLEGKDEIEQCPSSTTSSIGKDSDVSWDTKLEDIENESEAQSAYKYDEPLDMMDSLQHVLPIRYFQLPFSDHTSLVCLDKNHFVIYYLVKIELELMLIMFDVFTMNIN